MSHASRLENISLIDHGSKDRKDLNKNNWYKHNLLKVFSWTIQCLDLYIALNAVRPIIETSTLRS